MYYGCFEDRSNGMTTPGSFAIRGRTLFAIVQGGMDVALSLGLPEHAEGDPDVVHKIEICKRLFFRGGESLPFGHAIRPVQERIDDPLTGVKLEREAAAA
jgi:hypothetical protein